MEYSALTVNLLTAFLIIVLTLVIANILGNIVKRVLKGMGANEVLARELKLKVPLEETISSILRYVIYLVGAIAVLNQLGIPTRILLIVFLIVLAVIIAFTVLSLKDVVPNIASGIYIKKTKKIKRGETIKVKGIEGRILAINLLETKIETKDKEIIFVPNTILVKEEVRRV